jgi:hypothetical protein
MWVFTTGGFVSAVQHRDNPDLVMVRARDKQSLEIMIASVNARQELQLDPALEITTTLNADYPHRVTITKAQWIQFLTTETEDFLNYENFKSELDRVRGKKFHDAAMRVWVDMHAVEDVTRPKVRDRQHYTAWGPASSKYEGEEYPADLTTDRELDDLLAEAGIVELQDENFD